MKRAIYPLFAAADERRVKPLLEALQKKGVTVRADRAAPGKGDALLLFLSENLQGSDPAISAFFRFSPGRKLVIPVDLDGVKPPAELQNALMARHAIQARRYAIEELAGLIKKAVRGKSALPLILSLLAAALLLAGGFVLYQQLSRQGFLSPAATETPTAAPTAEPTPAPTEPPHVEGIEVDLTQVAEIVYVGDTFRYYTLSEGYHRRGSSSDKVRGYQEVAYEGWDEKGVHYYSTENGQEIPQAELGDVSYLQLLPNLMYLTFVNVQGTLPDLSALENMQTVTIYNCQLPDLDGLRGCGVRTFRYDGATVKDFTPLNDCPYLMMADLSLRGDPAGVDLSAFHPAKVSDLTVDGAAEDLGGLNQCKRLRSLSLRNNHMTDLSCLKGLELEYLRLQNCDRLTSFAGLDDMDTLQQLRVSGCNRLRDISALRGCRSLTTVDLSADNGWMDQLTDVSVLGWLPRLQSIGLYGANLRELDFLKNLNIKKNVNLGFYLAGNIDCSGLEAIDSFNYLHVNAGGNYAAAAPYLAGKTVRQLMIYEGGLVDLSTLPQVTGELDLCRCRNTDLTGIPEMSFGSKLWIQDCPYFSSFAGIENIPGIGRKGSTLKVEGCPRLTDWSAIEGKAFHLLELERVFTLPDFSRISFTELSLGYIDRDTLPDLHCLDALDENGRYDLSFVGMDQIVDLSPLYRLRGHRLRVPPQVAEQAQGLVDDRRFNIYEIAYPNGGWDPNDVRLELASLEELTTLPSSLLKHVKKLTIVGDELVNQDETSWWTDWSTNPPVAVLRDRNTGEEKPINKVGSLFTDLSAFSALTGLEELELWWQPLTDLEGIQGMENLRRLAVEFCPKMADPSAAFTLQRLRDVNFERCPITSLQGVQNLYDLERLEVCNTRITSLEGIEGLTRLSTLRISGTNVRDFSPLGAVDFTYAAEQGAGVELSLNVAANGSRLPKDAFQALSHVPAFRRLEVHNTPADRWLSCLQDKPIRELDADNTGLTQEQFDALVEAHPELERISVLSNRRITDASALLGLENLQEVWLSRDMQKAIDSLGSQYPFELHIG